MADLSLVADNYLPTASETFTDNLSGSISAGAAIVPVNSAVEYPTGATVVLTVEPGTSNEATFIGKKDTGNQFIECIWTEGNTAVGHAAGVTIIDYDSATHYNVISKAMQLIMNQDGTLKDTPIRTALGLTSDSTDGWSVFPYTFSVSSGYNKGQKEFDLTVANQDVRSILSVGMKLRLARGTTAPTQCLDLESSSSQYAGRSGASVSGITFTDDFTLESWIKPESYNSATGYVVSRQDGGATGWTLRIGAKGQVEGVSLLSSGNNRTITSYLSVTIGIWSHIAVTMDNSAGSYTMYINGVSVNFTTTTTGALTAISQGVNVDVRIGSISGATPGNYFDGKISDVRVWNAVRTATQIRDNMNQQLVGTETNLVGYWKLNGNLNDSTSNANNLTGSGGAAATSTDNPMVSTEYAVITKIAYSAPNSTVTVYTGNEHNIPNMTLSSPYYSVQDAPYGFPRASQKWDLAQWFYNRFQANGTAGTWVNTGHAVAIPVGSWDLGYNLHGIITHAGAAFLSFNGTLSTTNSSETDQRLTSRSCVQNNSSTETDDQISKEAGVDISTQTTYYFNMNPSSSTSVVYVGDTGTQYEPTLIYAKFGLL